MTRKAAVIALLLLSFSGVAPLGADVVILKKGGGFIGEILSRDDDTVVIETVQGKVAVPLSDVASVASSPSVVQKYKEKSRNAVSARDHYNLAVWCIRNGYEAAARKEYAAAVRLDPAMRKKNPFPVPSKEEQARKEAIRRKIEIGRILAALRYTRDPERQAEYKKQLDRFSPGEKRPLLEEQLRLTAPKFSAYRNFLLDELAALPDIDAKVFIEHLLREPDKSLRMKTIRILKSIPEGPLMLERAMIQTVAAADNYSLRSRVNAEETLGAIRSEAGTAVLIKRLKMHWGPSSRCGYVRFTRRAYVRDVTPVVANGATSFDPEIDTYTTGMVLDVKIRSVEREVIIRALREITGLVLPDAEAWIKWWEKKERERYTARKKK